jgi:hypothetical protein
MTMPQEIFKADRRFRKKLFTVYAACILILGLFVWLCLPLLIKYLNACAIPKFLNLMEICVLAFLLFFIGPALFLINTGRKILLYKQVPYPGMKVIRDTKILSGKKAIFRGRLLVILGIFSIIMAIIGSIGSHYYFEKFRHFNPFHSTVREAIVGNPPTAENFRHFYQI